MGFVVGGYCPGTSCVAGMSGRLDGLVALAGMVLGIVVFGELYPAFAVAGPATATPGATLPELLGWSRGMVVGGIALLALVAFLLIDRWQGSLRP